MERNQRADETTARRPGTESRSTRSDEKLYLQRKVPVGATPVSRYATWDEHRAAISRDAASYRTAAAERNRSTVK